MDNNNNMGDDGLDFLREIQARGKMAKNIDDGDTNARETDDVAGDKGIEIDL